MFNIVLYQTSAGEEPLMTFLDSLKNAKYRTRIQARLDRVQMGNFGDFCLVGDDVSELRFFFGSGYRVYFGLDGKDCVILLCGGNKSTQKKDIRLAKQYWKEYKETKLS